MPLSACAHFNVLNDPAVGWKMSRSEHFVLYADFNRPATNLLATLEQTYGALRASFFPGVEVDPIEIMVAEDPGLYDELVGDRTPTRFVTGAGTAGGLLVLSEAEDTSRIRRLVAHELTHRFAHRSLPGLPSWLEEGLALYFETLEIRASAVWLGAAPLVAQALNGAGTPSLAPLFASSASPVHSPTRGADDAASWALVYYFLNAEEGAYQERFSEFIRRMQPANADASTVLGALFPEKPRPALEAAVFAAAPRYNSFGGTGVRAVAFSPPPPRPFTIGDADPAVIRKLHQELRAHRPAPAASPSW